MNTRTRLPRAKRDELVAIYMAGGMRAVEVPAKLAGVTAKHVANVASYLGMVRHRAIPGVSSQTRDDPRWERAKAIGEVRA